MPSELVHLAFASVLASTLLGKYFTPRSLVIVLFVTTIPDLDTFFGILWPGTHRAALHSITLPLFVLILIGSDWYFRDNSILKRAQPWTVRVITVSIISYIIGGIGPDLFYNGVNLFYPFHDRFYALAGDLYISNERGFVQTIWQPQTSIGETTATAHFSTGVDVVRGPDPVNTERIFPIAQGGIQVLFIATAILVTSVRLWQTRNQPH